jgi:YD repeat-containing protein
MVSVVSGSGLGLANSASAGLGGAGSWAQAGQGRAGEQVSVNAATGNLVVQNRDEFLAGVGADIALLRTYNSRGGWDGDNADGWRLGYYRRVGGLAGTLNAAGSSIRRIEADGFEATYSWRDGRYVSTDGAGAHDSLSVDPASGTATWTDGDTGATETYQADPQSPGDYRLVALTDPEGHQVRIEHDAQGLIRSLATWRAGASAASETVLLQYDANRRLVQVDTTTQGDGGTTTRTRVRYGYDDQGRLAAVHTDLSPEDRSVADGHVYSVHYTYDPAGRLRTLTQTDGSALTIDYDTQGRVHLLTDALGRTTRFGYDDATRTTTVTDPLQQTTQLTHDAAGRLLQVRGAALGSPTLSQTHTYDADGNLATLTDARNQTTRFAYDERGNLIRRTDPAGHVQEQRYDAANRLTGQTQYTTPDPDGAGPLLAGGALTTHHVYDTSAGLRRLRFTISPAGRVTEHQYNALGQVATTLTYTRGTYVAGSEPTLAQLTDWAAALSPADRAAAQRQTFAYDLRGQLATSTRYAGATVSGSTVSWTAPSTTHYTHDPFGRLLQTIDPDGRTQARAYDGLDRLILSTDAAGTTVYRHDDALRQTTVQLASPDGVRPGLRTVSTYDAAGLLLSQARFDGTTPLGTTRHFHDDAGRLRMSEDPTGARQWWLYDPAGRPVASIDALGHVSVTSYDAAGRVVRVTAHATPISTAALVDADGRPRPLALADLALTAHADDRRQWQLHDAAGRLRYSVSSLGEVSETRYDGTGRVVAQVQYARRLASLPAAGQALDPAVLAALPTDPQDRLTRSLYDADGLLRATLDAEGYLTEMRHDGAGRGVERIAYAGRVPEAQRAGTLSQLLTGAGTSTFDQRSLWWYDPQGRVSAELDAEGYFTAHTYSDAGLRTHTLRHARALTPAAALAARATSDPATLRPAGSPQDRSTAWAYDEQGRLETETASDGTVTRHTYDGQGRLTRTERALGTAEVRSHLARYDAQGRITAELSAEGAARLATGQTQAQVDAIWAAHATTHAYDAAGRRIRSTDALGRATVFYYDAAGRLSYRIRLTDQGGEVQASTYTAFGEVAGTRHYTRRLATSGLALPGGLATPALDQLIAALADTTDARSTTVYNQRGQVQQAIDALGFKTETSYDAFGQVQQTRREAGSAPGDGRVLRTDHSYDRRGLLTATVQDPTGLQASTRTEYDAFGRITAQSDARNQRTVTEYLRGDGSADGGRQVVITDPLRVARTTTYDAFDRVIRQTDALNQVTRIEHDDAQRRVTITTPEGVRSVTESNRHGQVVKLTDGNGTTTYVYDADGRLLTRTDALGQVTRHGYDAAGQLQTQEQGLRLDANGQLAGDAATATRFTYDAAGRVLTRQVDPAGLKLTTSYQYDGQGRALRVTDAAGTVTRYDFNARGELAEVVVDDRPGGLQLRTTTAYDAQGRTLRVTEGAGTAAARTTEYRYDLLGRRTHEVVDPAGLKLTTAYEYDAAGNVVLRRDALGHATRYVYDAAGRLQVSLNAAGEVTQTLRDQAGRVTGTRAYARRLGDNDAVRVWYQAGTNSSLARSLGSFQAGDVVTATVRFKADQGVSGGLFVGKATGAFDPSQYTGAVYGQPDGDGWQTVTVTYRPTAAGEAWVYLYGDRDGADAQAGHGVLYDWVRVTSTQRGTVLDHGFETAALYGGPSGAGSEWGRNGVLAERVQADAVLDPASLSDAQILQALPGLADARDTLVQAAYDRDGRQVIAVDAMGGVTRFQYDAGGRVVETTRYATPHAGAWLASSAPVADAARDQRTSHIYDAVGRLRYTVDALGYASETRYDAAGRVVMHKRYANAITRPATMAEADVRAAVNARLDATRDRTEYTAYDAAGRARFQVDAEGYVTERQFDALGRVTATYRHAGKLSLADVPTAQQLAAATTTVSRFDTGAQGVSGTAHVWENGQVKLVSRPEAGGGWAGTRSSRGDQPLGGSVRFDLTPHQLQQALHAGVDSNATRNTAAFGRLVALLQPDGHVYAQVYAGTQGTTVDLGTYVPGTTYTVEITSSEAGTATLYFYAKGQGRDSGYIYRTGQPLPWPGFSTVFYTSRSAALAAETTATVDNLEERTATVTSSRYDAAGRLTHSVDAEGVVTRHEYDEAGRETRRTQAHGLPEASTTTWTYDAAGRRLTETLAAGTAQAATTAFRYDSNGRLIARIDPRGVAAAAGSLTAAQKAEVQQAYTTRYGYDATGRPTTTIDALGGTTTTRYDALGNALRSTDVRGFTTYTTYDKLNRAIQQVDAGGHLTTNTYDAFGNITDTYRYAGRVVRPEDGPVTVVTAGASAPATGAYLVDSPALTAHTRIEFDRRNQRLASTDAEGHAERATYNAFGDADTRTNKLGGTASFQYDRRGLMVQETLPVQARRADGTLVPVVNQYQHDHRGNRTTSIEAVGLPEQRTTQYRFDATGRLVRTIGMPYTAVDAAGATATVTPVDQNRYDALGRLVEQVRQGSLSSGAVSGGRRSLAWYDAAGQKTGELSADAVLARFEYDLAGNQTVQTLYATRLATWPATGGTPPAAALSANDRRLNHSYDSLNRKTETRLQGVLAWDSIGTLVSTKLPAPPEPITIALETLVYDAAGNIIRRTDARGHSSYSYHDALNRQVLAIDAAGYAVAWDYARPGSTATQETRYARAVPVAWALQGAGSAGDPQALRNAVAALGADPNEADRITTFTLDRLGRVTEKALLNVAYAHVLDSGTRVARTAHAVTRYAYNGLGMVRQIQERVGELDDVATTSVWQTTDIEYDALGRETRRLSPGFVDHEGASVRPQADTEYDGLGRTSRHLQRGKNANSEADDRITRYAYDSAGRLAELVDAGGGVIRNAYDAQGNLVRQTRVAVLRSDLVTRRDLVKTWQHDAAGRITVETDLDTGEVRRTRYNAFGEVEAKGLGSDATQWQEFAEYTTLGKVSKTNAGDGAIKFYLHDVNGNVTREIRAGVNEHGSRDLRNVTLQQAAIDSTLMHTTSVYDPRNLLIRTIQPLFDRTASSVTLSQQITEDWVPQWADASVPGSGAVQAPTAGVGQGTPHTTVTTSAGAQTTIGASAPATVSDGLSLGALPSSSRPGALTEAVLRFGPILQPHVQVPADMFRHATLTIPANWPAGAYRAKETLNAATARRATAQPTLDMLVGMWAMLNPPTVAPGGTFNDAHKVLMASAWNSDAALDSLSTEVIEWQEVPNGPWIKVAEVTIRRTVDWTKRVLGPSGSLPPASFDIRPTWDLRSILAVDPALWKDTSGSATAATFRVLVDGQLMPQALGQTGAAWPPAGHRWHAFTLSAPDRPTLSAGSHKVQILAFDASGKLLRGKNYTITGADVSTLTEVAGDAGGLYKGSQGTAWAEHTRNTAGQVASASLRWDLGSGTNTSGTFRWRLAGSSEGWGAASFSGGAIALGAGSPLALADGVYEYVLDNIAGAPDLTPRHGRFTMSGGAVVVTDLPTSAEPLPQSHLRTVSLTAETLTLAGPVHANGRVLLQVGGSTFGTFESTTDANGRATFDVAAIRRYLGLDRWTVADLSITTIGYILHPNGTRQVTQSDRGTLHLNPRLDTGAGFTISTDGVPEYRAVGLIALPSATGTLTLTPIAANGSRGTPVTLPVDGSDWRVAKSAGQLDVDLRTWLPAWGAAAQTVEFQFSGTSAGVPGLLATGRFSVAHDGKVSPIGTITQNTNRPLLPVTIAGASKLASFRMRVDGGAWIDVIASGKISGTGPTFTWDVSAYLGKTLTYEFVAQDGNSKLVSRGGGTVTVSAGGAVASQAPVVAWMPAEFKLTPPSGTTALTVTLYPNGRDTGAQKVQIQPVRQDNGSWVYDVEAYVTASDRKLEYDFVASNNGTVLSTGKGSVTIAPSGATSGSADEEYRPVDVPLIIRGRNVQAARLVVDGRGTYTNLKRAYVEPELNSDGSIRVPGYTTFTWDAAADRTPAKPDGYVYTLTLLTETGATMLDELGQPLVRKGLIKLGAGATPDVQVLTATPTFKTTPDLTISRHQTHNAFGEVIEERDERVEERMTAMLGRAPGTPLSAEEQAAARTTLRYNTLGRLIARIEAQTSQTLENGYRERIRPTTLYGYDLLGRLVTQTDANGHVSRQVLRAGSEQVLVQVNADDLVDRNSRRRTAYDIFGDARRITDEEGSVTQQTYDAMGRLTQVDRLGVQRVDANGAEQAAMTLSDKFTYDQLGQRLTHTNALTLTTRTDYDGLGRITSTYTANGFETRYEYALASVTGLNGSTATGHQRTTYQPDGRTMVDRISYFGQTTWHRDLSGTQTTYSYDAAARLVHQSSTVHPSQQADGASKKGQDIHYTYYANGYIKSAQDDAAETLSEYGYDEAGNRVSETYYGWKDGLRGHLYQNATIEYDELNRIVRVKDTHYFDIRYEYDAVGNRRLVDSTYWDGVAGLHDRQTYWYAYDKMNRFTVTKGALSSAGGARATARGDNTIRVTPGEQGVLIGYDRTGRRTAAVYKLDGKSVTDQYGYSRDGYVQTLRDAAGTLKEARVLDAIGRTLEQHDKQNKVSTVSRYDADNRLLRQSFTDHKDASKNSYTTYRYYTDATENVATAKDTGAGALAVTFTDGANTETVEGDGEGNAWTVTDHGTDTTTTYTYHYWDDARQNKVETKAEIGRITYSYGGGRAGQTTRGSTVLSYNANGHLIKAVDTGPAKDITTTYTNSAHGLILQRQSVQAGVKVGTHHYYYADGRRVGDVGDDPAENSRVSYAEALARKGQDPQDRNNLYRNFKPVTAADFDQNYEPINPGYPAPTGSSYTARGGETLRNVAHALWGDQALWYLIAEVNGLDGSQALQQGQVLVIPNKVTNIHNNSQTVRPYNPGEAIGHIDPTLPPPPPPPQGGGCGALGMIIVIAVAVVVTAATSGAAAAALNTAFGTTGGLGAAAATAAGYAAGAALGSIASQGVAMAIGMQDKFDWRSVGQAALGGAASGAVTALTAAGGGLASLAGDGWEAVGRATLSSAGTQVLRGHWDWREVVASAVSTGVGGDAQAGGTLGATLMATGARFAGNWLSSRITTGEANPRGAWVQTIGNTVGDFIAATMSSPSPADNRTALNIANRIADPGYYSVPPAALAGSGLRVSDDMLAAGRPRYGFDEPLAPADYGLVGDGRSVRFRTADYATVQRGNTLEGIAQGDRELMGRYIAGMGLKNADLLQPGQALVADWGISAEQASALAGRSYAAHAAQQAHQQTALLTAQAQAATYQAIGGCTPDNPYGLSQAEMQAMARQAVFSGGPPLVGTGSIPVAAARAVADSDPFSQLGPEWGGYSGQGAVTSSIAEFDRNMVKHKQEVLDFIADHQLGSATYVAAAVLVPGSFVEGALLAGGPLVSKAAGAGIGLLNKVPWLGADVGAALGTAAKATGRVIGPALDDAVFAMQDRMGLILRIVPDGPGLRVGTLGNVKNSVDDFIADVHSALGTKLNSAELAEFRALDPTAKIGLTGSSATGRVGNPNKPTFGQPINMDKFDLDLFVQSDVLLEQFGARLKAAPILRQELVDDFPTLFQGLKPGKEGLSIKFRPHGEPPKGSIIFGE